MSDDLTYLALRTVLEYLDPNKRIHIAARSSALRNVDKSIPIHFHYLSVGPHGFELENIESKLHFWVEDPFFMRFRHYYSNDLEIRFKSDETGRQISRRLPKGLTLFNASGVLELVWLSYKKIYTNYLEFEPMGKSVVWIPCIPKILTKALAINNNDLEGCLHFLRPPDFPLKTFALHSSDLEDVDHPLAKTAESLEIHLRGGLPLDFLMNLPNKNVKIHDAEFMKEEMIWLIENWESRIGRSFSFQIFEKDSFREVLLLYKERFAGEFKSLNKKEIPYCVSIPVSATSELNIYGFKDKGKFFIAIEEHPIGTSLPFSDESEPNAPLNTIIPMVIKKLIEKTKSVERFEQEVQGVGPDGFGSEKIESKLHSCVEERYPFFMSFKRSHSEYLEIEFENDKAGCQISRRLPSSLTMSTASRTMARVLLGYKKIYTDYLEFESIGNSVLSIPTETKFLTKVLDINDNDLEECLELLHHGSLNTFALSLDNLEALEDPLARYAESVEIHVPDTDSEEEEGEDDDDEEEEEEEDLQLDVLMNLPNKNVTIHNVELWEEEMIWLIENWESRIGRTFNFEVDSLTEVLLFYKEQFGGEFKILNEKDIPYCVSIPISAKSELNIHGYQYYEGFFIRIEEQPIGSALPFVTESVPNAPLSSIIPMMIQGLKEKPDAVNNFILDLSMLAMIICSFLILLFVFLPGSEEARRTVSKLFSC